MIEDLRPKRRNDAILVDCIVFDDFLINRAINDLALIKIDVEGAELDVLKGMVGSLKRYQPLVICEVLFTDRHANLRFMEERNTEFKNILIELEYQIFRIVKDQKSNGIQYLERLTDFENKYWKRDNANLCDYLFIPESLPISSGVYHNVG